MEVDSPLKEIFRNLRANRWFRLAVYGLAAFLLLQIIRAYLTNGSLTIKTDQPTAIISLEKISENGEKKLLSSHNSRLRAKVPPGNYLISAKTNYTAVSKQVTVTSRHHDDYYLKLGPGPLSLEAVLPANATFVSASTDHLYYVDGDSHLLTRLDSRGIPTIVDRTHFFKTFAWADDEFGVGQTDNGQLYVFDGGLRSLALPISQPSDTPVSYAVSPTRLIYVAKDKSIYFGRAGGDFKLFGNSKSSEPTMIAGVDSVAVLNTIKGDEEGGEGGGYEPELTVYSGGKQTAQKEIEASHIVWSPDGKYIATDGDFGAKIYDTSLKEVASLNGGNFNDLTWLDNKTLIYAQNDSLWRYNMDYDQSTLLTSSLSKELILGVHATADGSSVYFVTEGRSNHVNTLNRVRVRGGSTTFKQVQALSIFFPSRSQQCGFSYSNFTRPLVIITGWTNKTTCLDAAKEELKADNLSGLPIIFAPEIHD